MEAPADTIEVAYEDGDPTSFREPVNGKDVTVVVPDIVDVKAIRTAVMDLVNTTTIHPVSLADTTRELMETQRFQNKAKRDELIETKKFVMGRLGELCAAIDQGIADCDVADSYVNTGIGEAPSA